jgi:CBS domain-containing protein
VSSLTMVGKIMTPKPRSVSAETHATHVRSLFRDGGFRSVPVVSNNRLEGIITRADVLNISSTKSNIDARGIMQHVKVIATPDMDVNDLCRKILEAHVVHAPVIQSADNMQLVGIITLSDILKLMLEDKLKPPLGTVKDVFTQKVVSCDYQDLISHVWSHMDQTGFSGLPVLKKGKLIGMITRKDIIDSGHIRINRESDDMHPSIKVEKVMKTPPIVVTPKSSVQEAAELIIKYDIGRLPVVENPVYIKNEPNRAKLANLLGIISREDILWSYLT